MEGGRRGRGSSGDRLVAAWNRVGRGIDWMDTVCSDASWKVGVAAVMLSQYLQKGPGRRRGPRAEMGRIMDGMHFPTSGWERIRDAVGLCGGAGRGIEGQRRELKLRGVGGFVGVDTFAVGLGTLRTGGMGGAGDLSSPAVPMGMGEQRVAQGILPPVLILHGKGGYGGSVGGRPRTSCRGTCKPHLGLGVRRMGRLFVSGGGHWGYGIGFLPAVCGRGLE